MKMKLWGTVLLNLFFADQLLAKTYTVGVEDHPFLPFSQVENKKYQGVFKDILESFSRNNDVKFKYVPLPLNRLYSEFYDGKIDFKVPANAYWQSDTKKSLALKIHYSQPLVAYTDGVMVHQDNVKMNEKNLTTLSIVSGFTPWKYLDRIKKGEIKVTENLSLEGLLQQLILKRIPAIYVNIDVANYYLARKFPLSQNNVLFHKGLPSVDGTYHIGSLNHPDITKKIDDFMDAHPDVLNKIRAKYSIK